MGGVESRLSKLEARNRMLSFVLVVALGGLAVLLSAGAAPVSNKAIEADSITFRDAKGNPRMVLKAENDGKGVETFGIQFFGTDAQEIGSLRSEGDRLFLSLRQSAASRQAAAMWELAEAEKSVKPERKDGWQKFRKQEIDRIVKTGRLVASLTVNGIVFVDESADGFAITSLSERALSTRAITVAGDPRLDVKAQEGSITVVDGNVTTRSSKDERKAVLGSTSLINNKTGDEIQAPPSSLTVFDKDGKVTFRAP